MIRIESLTGGLGTNHVAIDRFLVPAEEPEIIRYFLDRLFVSHGMRERLSRISMRAGLSGLRRRRHQKGVSLRFLAGGTEPVISGGGENSHRAPPAVLFDPLASWAAPLSLLREALGTRELRWRAGADGFPLHRTILLRDYDDAGRARILLFPFPGGTSRPSAIIKVRGRDGTGGSLKEEWESLQWVRSRINDPRVLASIPEPRTFREAPGVEILVLSHLEGSSVYWEQQNCLLPRRRAAAHMMAASDWLVAFHRACGTGTWAETGPCHGDFWARNLLLTSSRRYRGPVTPMVVDWESFSASGSPSHDLFHFPLTYVENYPWRRYRRLPFPEAFRLGFLERTEVSRAVEVYFTRYCLGTGFDPRKLEGLFRDYLLTEATAAGDGRSEDWRACLGLLGSTPSVLTRCGH